MAAFGKVVGINLKGEVAVGAGYLVHDHVDDGLREADGVARHLGDGVGHGLHQLGLGAAALPCVVGLEAHAYLDMREGEAFGSFVVAS